MVCRKKVPDVSFPKTFLLLNTQSPYTETPQIGLGTISNFHNDCSVEDSRFFLVFFF